MSSDKVTTAEDESSTIQLAPELWRHILSFSSPVDLCSISLANKELHAWSGGNRYWKKLCFLRWKGKQNVARFIHTENLTWKQRYAWAEFDKHRPTITQEEVCYFSWKLIYNGQESRLGLRKFSPDGTYTSPYAGVCEWTLLQNRLCFMGIALPVERSEDNWGWVFGKGYSTQYTSVEDTTGT